MIEFIKRLVKFLNIYSFFEWWIINTNLGMNIYLGIIASQAHNKGIKVKLDKSDTNLKFLISKKERVVIISSRHYAYLQDIINNFNYYFNAVQPTTKKDGDTVDYSTPRQHILLPSHTPFFFSSFAEPLETTKIYLDKGQLKEGDVVLDLGSYCGSTVWGFSNAVGKSGKVYGFEPDPTSFEMLSKNVEYHNLSNVTLINKGVWSFNGNILFQSEGNMGSGVSTVQNRSTNQITIQTISLNDFCKKYSVNKIDYIKMDIEGAETEVLRSSHEVLRKYKPRLIIEPHIVNSHITTNEICKILSEFGYITEILAQSDLPLPLIYAQPTSMETAK